MLWASDGFDQFTQLSQLTQLDQIKESFTVIQARHFVRESYCSGERELHCIDSHSTPLVRSLCWFFTFVGRKGGVCYIVHEASCVIIRPGGEPATHWSRASHSQLSWVSCSLWSIRSRTIRPYFEHLRSFFMDCRRDLLSSWDTESYW
jgi:hypothetical protein